MAQSTSEKRVCLAERAEQALKDFLTESNDMLWPEERRTLTRARNVLADHLGDSSGSED